MKRFLFLIVIIIILGCTFVNSKEKEITEIQRLQEKVVAIHNKLLKKEAKIESINLEILIGKQKQAILKQKIKDNTQNVTPNKTSLKTKPKLKS